MKLSWKIFFITTPLFILFLTVFGTWIIQESYQSSLEREIQRCMAENQMFQNSYELTVHSLSDEQAAQTDTRKVVESFYRRGKDGSVARIYREDGEVLYQSEEWDLETDIPGQLNDDHNVGCAVVRRQGIPYIVVVSRSSLGVFIETARSLENIYMNREDMFSRYRIGVLLMAVLVGGLLLLALFLVMRNMQKLSRATRQFARGQYDVRVDIRSTDEIGMLAADFNWMANAMNTQMEQMKNEVRRQEEFTAAFAHELKTPLTSIIGYADTIRQMELSPEETDMCADYIFRQGKRLQSLSYKLLDMAMAGQQQMTYREIFAPELFAEVARTVELPLAQKHQNLHLQIQDGYIYGDRELLASLFINLIDNGRKASQEGASIWITGENVPGGYCVVVQDEGRGIAPEELSRITEAFYMVDKSRARKEGGAGLGLALCQKIVELHQAGWQFESEPGRGLKVTVMFGLPKMTPRARRKAERRNGRLRGRSFGRRKDSGEK